MVDGSVLQGRYRLERRLAAGGMGAVYQGLDERLHRKVAVKLLKEEFAGDPRFIERFRREARAVASLSHPYIANVYDYGEDAGRYFIVMEFAPGRDLARVLSTQAPLPVERAVSIGAQLCEALGHAHAAGIIHRDVKPANIVIDDDRFRVTDFGIARVVGDSTLTATGSILGSAHYLSPEQARSTTLTPASDLYSAGIVVYEMLTGTVPFTGDSAIAVAMQHMNDHVPPPSSINPAVPSQLDEVIARATTKAPSGRFQTAQEMADALRDPPPPATTLITGGTTTSPPSSTQTAWPIPGGRNDRRLIGRAVVLMLLGLGLVAGSLLAFRLVTDDDDGAAQGGDRPRPAPAQSDDPAGEDPAQDVTEATPTPTESPTGILISEDAIGANSKDVEKLLEGQGVLVETIEQDSEEEKHTVLGTEPSPGTTVSEGDTVTLIVSTGKVSDEDGDDDE